MNESGATINVFYYPMYLVHLEGERNLLPPKLPQTTGDALAIALVGTSRFDEERGFNFTLLIRMPGWPEFALNACAKPSIFRCRSVPRHEDFSLADVNKCLVFYRRLPPSKWPLTVRTLRDDG